MGFFLRYKRFKKFVNFSLRFLSFFFSGKRVVQKTIKTEKELKNIFEIQ